jgi:RimJ/RimL family protein N-acetyltransferase
MEQRMEFFETERLILLPTTTNDAAFVRKIMNSPKYLEFVGDRKIHSDKAAKEYIEEKMLPQFERLGFGNFTLLLKSDNTKIGFCGLFDRPGMKGLDLGYALLPEFEGKGYAFEAASFLLARAFDVFGQNEVKAITLKTHTASINLLKKLGFMNHGTITLPGDDEELLLFSISKKDTVEEF